MSSRDIEQQELDRVLDLLGKGTRPGRLLAYIGAKYFQEQEEQLTEFHIATEVFGRSTKNFDSTQDAVVRVEVHRLRKKLRDIYEKGGDTHGIQISLPAGTYAPKFLPPPLPQPGVTDPSPDTQSAVPASAEAAEQIAIPRPGRKRGPYLLAVAGVLCAAILAFVLGDRLNKPDATSQTSLEGQSQPATPSEGEAREVHLMAGYSGSDVIDNSGVRWTPDRFFKGGGQWPRDSSFGFVRGTSRSFLFANWRTGEFTYDIPLQRGIYEMRLFFVSSHHVGDEKLAGFNVALNGNPLLTAFDVNISAHGADVAEEKVFTDVAPDKDGFVRLWFSNQVSTPSLNALEIVPGIPNRLKPIRILTQPTSFVDHKGQRWRADDYYLNGFRSTERRKVGGTDDPELFGGERYGHFAYAIPVDTRGRYTVVLHFAEFYFGPQLQGGGGVGSRVFNVFCNGQTLLQNFDVYREGGSLQVVTKTFSNVQPSAQGKINLTFEPVINNATVSGIEILDESD
ncbi:MAG TPA: malectin domain-containing carbohydrate-binding protein [Povalibacter sp.]